MRHTKSAMIFLYFLLQVLVYFLKLNICESNETPFVVIQHLYQELFGDNQGSVSTARLCENQHVRYLQSAKLIIFPMLGFLGTFSMSV